MPIFKNVALEALETVLPDEVITSAAIEDKLKDTYERLKLPAGRLELMTGIKERRFWENGMLPSTASSLAGKKVLESAGIKAEEVEVMMHAAVSRDFLEPATASVAHKKIGLSQQCQIFDVSNACLGFLNSFSILAAMIECGHIKRGMVVSGENGRPLVEKTIDALLNPEMTRKSVKPHFASLTIGCGASAAILCHKSLAPDAPQLLGGETLTASEHSDLCQGDTSNDARLEMATDSEKLMQEGVKLARQTYAKFIESHPDFSDDVIKNYIGHQVGAAHRNLLFSSLELSVEKDFSTFPDLGNIGSVSLPITLERALTQKKLQKGDKAVLMGIGSGINCMFMALQC